MVYALIGRVEVDGAVLCPVGRLCVEGKFWIWDGRIGRRMVINISKFVAAHTIEVVDGGDIFVEERSWV